MIRLLTPLEVAKLSRARSIQERVLNSPKTPDSVIIMQPGDVALGVEGVRGCAMFQPQEEGVWLGHYLFPYGRAGSASKEILAFMFDSLGADLIRGITPRDNRAARYLSRYLGFLPKGETVDCHGRPSIKYELSRELWAVLSAVS